ncbi:hypothetical protein FOZ60_015309 [Perkinsus olseni]|uniref:Uncharacterized protein n=1 Tax=Perkinsus olseni TaxID=32597 RepID=A0A7J6N5R6_PEROL|nr:hypothetical protein FOZ60_015309 [Perkinsus olseni]
MVPVTKGPLMSWFEGDAQDYSHEAVAELRCDNSGHIEGSLSHLRKIYNSLVSVFANDISQSKQLVRQAIGALPNLGAQQGPYPWDHARATQAQSCRSLRKDEDDGDDDADLGQLQSVQRNIDEMKAKHKAHG